MDIRALPSHRTDATSRSRAVRLLLGAVLLATLAPTGHVHAQSYPNSLGNTVTVTLPPTVTDPQTGNNTATDVNTLAAEASLTLDKALLTPSPVRTGDPVTYRILVTNAGPSAALGATIADTVPAQLGNVGWTCAASAGSSCGSAGGTGNVSLVANIAPAGSITIDVTGTAPPTTPSTVAANTATVSLPPGTADPDPGDNTDTTPPIPVVPRAIEAVPDNAGPVDGGPGQVNVINVLANDTLDSAPVTLVLVAYTPTSTPPLTLNPDGTVDVAAGTPTGVYTASYQICETANPSNCDTASVTVTVNAAATIDAVDDTLPPQAEGNISLTANVLDNDRLNGAPVTGLVTLTSPNTGVITIAADGTVTLSPATTAGIHSTTYRICETANPANCDSATVTVRVLPPIGAVDDSLGPVNGVAGNPDAGNVLANDTASNVTPPSLTVVSLAGTNTAQIVFNADGSITVPPGTPAGSYSTGYTICYLDAPTVCDSATVQVTVTVPGVLVANDDAFGPIDGTAGNAGAGNVLGNDTLNGSPVSPIDITLTPTNAGTVTIATDGTVSVAPNTPAGTYTPSYRICENLNPTNCDTATVTVTVATVDAVNDTLGPSQPGTSAGNVLANDFANGVAATPATVTLTQTSGTPSLTIAANGDVAIAAGTPSGTLNAGYQICLVSTPTICDSAIVSVTVAAGNLIANDDAFGPIDGTAGNANAGNVLGNDTLNGSPVSPVDITLTPTNAGTVTIATDGTVSVAPNTPAGTYTPGYRICENLNPANCDTATVAVTVATVDAVDDTLGPSQSGTSAGNVLANDFANGVAATPAAVTLTQTAGTPALTIAANGDVTIAAGTPSGTLNAAYQICLISAPTICDSATVAVNVAAGNLIANDDAFGPIDGAAGNAGAGNVLGNDTLNGSPVSPVDITLTPTNAGTVTIATDGTVSVAPNTPAGTYTPSYRICENLNPTNCDTATVTVTVATVDAVNDALGPSQPGTSAGNVLSNDFANGVAATPAAVTLTQTAGAPALTIAANGDVTIAPGTPAGTLNAGYQICLVSTPTICDSAIVSVTVAAGNLIANDDAFGPIDGTAGIANAGNVLGNDTLNGSPVNPADVTLTPTNAGNVTIGADGTVSVAPNTPAGTYTPSYRICENLNPANCDTATVTVTVATVDAVDDALGPSQSGTSAGNVLANDFANGVAATPAAVTLTQTAGTPALTIAANGDITIAPGTPAGTLNAGYRICLVAAPTICDSATVVVTVSTPANPIAANADSGNAGGRSGGNAVASVLANDSLSGSAPTMATVLLTLVAASTHPGITLDTGSGAVNVAPATPAGIGTLRYRICEQADPANCAEADVAITVTAAVIDAVDDTAGPVNGRTGGNAVTNVLGNDTLDGGAVNPADVAFTVLASDPPITLNPDGTVDVAANTAVGSYTATYRLCETLNPGNCDQAIATIGVVAAAIDAIDDTAPAAVSSVTGGQAVADVTGNDLLDGAPVALAQVTLAQVSSTHANVQLDAGSGQVNVAPRTPAGGYTLIYRLCERLNASNCDTATVTLTVGLPPVDARDDAPAPVPGGNPAINIVNVLANDLYNGGAASLADVTLVPVTQSPLTLNGDGSVDVAGGTPGGTYTLDYSLCDRINPSNCDAAVVTVKVNATLIAAANDAVQTPQDTPASIPVLSNDTYGGGPATNATVLVQSQSAPTSGTTTYPGDGTVTYTPGRYFSGSDSFQYRACERAAPTNCAVATVSVTVQPNTVTAVDDRVRAYDVAVTVPVLANDVAASAPLDPASLRVATAPSHGRATCAQGTCVYTPEADFIGEDRFVYSVCDVSVPTPVCAQANVIADVQAEPPALRLSKVAAQRTARIGDLVRYTLRIDNVGNIDALQVSLFDRIPEGFALVPESLRVGDDDASGALAQQRPMRVDALDIAVGRSATVSYVLRVGAGAGPGVHTNRAILRDAAGTALSNEATADVEIVGDPLLQDSLIIGSVFDDGNGNGRQDAGERGLPGVRLGSVEGLVIETDRHGRFHVAGIDGGRWARGRNFLLKVDVTSLPAGSRFTTENPRVLRITPGIPVRFDFGVRVPATQVGGDDGTSTDAVGGGRDGGREDGSQGGDRSERPSGEGGTGARASPDPHCGRHPPAADTVTRALSARFLDGTRFCAWIEARASVRLATGFGGSQGEI